MRFMILLVVLMLVGCDQTPTYKKELVADWISRFNESENLFEKKRLAHDISRTHWNKPGRLRWKSVGDDLTLQWRSLNCKPGLESQEEKRLLSRTRGRVAFNDYSSLASTYKKLFDLCGEESYLEQYAEFNALTKFASKTKTVCGEVVHTYSGGVVGSKILSTYKDLTSMNASVANRLGNQAVKGYGDCMCVMHDYFKVKDNFSIGFCMGPEYFSCSHPKVGGAYCGQSRDRTKLAAIIGDYEYSVPRETSSYGSYASPGSTAADLLEWGKAQTESLVRDYCSGNPDC
jgi:hypothetical protein